MKKIFMSSTCHGYDTNARSAKINIEIKNDMSRIKIICGIRSQ